MWWTWGAYDLTCSICWISALQGPLVTSCKRQAIRFAVSLAQACHASLPAVLLETLCVSLSCTGPACVTRATGEVTFWWMCKTPPVFLLSSRQATGQPSSELGMRPKLTRSAMSHSCSWEKEGKVNFVNVLSKILCHYFIIWLVFYIDCHFEKHIFLTNQIHWSKDWIY